MEQALDKTAHADDGPMDDQTQESVAAVRAFSRFYTRTLGLLEDGLLDTSYSLTEVRVLYELARQDEVELATLRHDLGLDAGYMSRVLTRLAWAGAIMKERSETDGRRQVVSLTWEGEQLAAMFAKRADRQVAQLLNGTTADEKRRLVGALQVVERTLDQNGTDSLSGPVVLRPIGAGDHGWVVHRHGALYTQEYQWDERFEALVARVVADFIDERRRNPDRVAGWVAEIDGEPAGCVYCTAKDETTAQLRLLLVEPSSRGHGVGSRLVEECIRFARRVGYHRMVLWTNHVLVDARRIYERAGFTLVAEEPHNDFGPDLVGQTWQLELIQPDPNRHPNRVDASADASRFRPDPNRHPNRVDASADPS